MKKKPLQVLELRELENSDKRWETSRPILLGQDHVPELDLGLESGLEPPKHHGHSKCPYTCKPRCNPLQDGCLPRGGVVRLRKHFRVNTDNFLKFRRGSSLKRQH